MRFLVFVACIAIIVGQWGNLTRALAFAKAVTSDDPAASPDLQKHGSK
jgi:hypothetical protein